MPYEETERVVVEGDGKTRVFLQPIAAPSILGLYGLAGALFIFAAQMTHWLGGSYIGLAIVPFVALFGGLAQFIAGMWAYKARDGVATAVHGTWGSFWMAFGILGLFAADGKVALPAAGMLPALGVWFIVLAAITWACTFAAMAENKSLVTVLLLLAAGSTITAIAVLAGLGPLEVIAGYVLIASSFAAWYAGTALMVNEAYGREVCPLGRSAEAQKMPRIAIGSGEPGVIRGQA